MSEFLNTPVLFIYVNTQNTELVKMYKSSIAAHNHHILNDAFPNAGFDLYIPNDTIIKSKVDMTSTLVDLEIKCEMKDGSGNPLAYYMYPRSSLSKTPLMLSHSVGIIDSGYRGNIKAAFRNFGPVGYDISKHSRMTQIVHPSMVPFCVRLLESETLLSSTTRGTGGFGSTGK